MSKIRIEMLTPGLDYAVSELKTFLARYTNARFTCCGEDLLLQLRVDDAMQPHWYSVHGDGKTQVFTGGNASSVLCAVYEALAHAGILFEAHGFSLPGEFSMDAFMTLNADVQPKVRQRGIRQHINFTMDISSYPLKEAQEYIRALARMRFNAITFHSYPGQWHSVDPSDPEKCAGHFFYGHCHEVPVDDELTMSRIRNRKIFCIPEVEAIYNEPAARAEYAIYWLNEVIKTAKEACMTVTLSVEPDVDGEEMLSAMLRDVCRLYPSIDVLEIISYECGGNFIPPQTPVADAPRFYADLLGDKILSADGTLEGLEDEVPYCLYGGSMCLKRMVTALSCREKWLPEHNQPKLCVGMYIPCVKSLRILIPMMRKLIPDDITFSMLPAHGAQVAADNIEMLKLTDADWQRFMLYSWAEFDGNMFMLQMSTDGLAKLTNMPDADSIHGVCVNHWRTAENALAIDLFAESAIRPTTTDAFYRAFAAKTGIADADAFVAACDRLAKLDSYAREELMNIGFPFEPCWYRPGHGVPLCNSLKHDNMVYGRSEYAALRDAFEALLDCAEGEQGIAFLRLMVNRCQASVLHIDALFAVREINEYFDFSNPVTPDAETAAKARDAIERASAFVQEYIHLYGEILTDRGCEGMVANYAATMPVFLRLVASHFVEDKDTSVSAFFDAPPTPDSEVIK